MTPEQEKQEYEVAQTNYEKAKAAQDKYSADVSSGRAYFNLSVSNTLSRAVIDTKKIWQEKGKVVAARALLPENAPTPADSGGTGSHLYQDILKALQNQLVESGETGPSADKLSLKFCQDVASAYDSWFRDQIHAGILPPQSTVPMTAANLRPAYMATWGATFGLYWTNVVWSQIPPYVQPISTINGTPIGAAMQAEISTWFVSNTSRTMEEFANLLSTTLAKYTKQLLVQAAMIVPPPGTQTLTVK